MATVLLATALLAAAASGWVVAADVALRVIELPFTLRAAYPWLALISGGLGVLVALYLILVRSTRRRPTR